MNTTNLTYNNIVIKKNIHKLDNENELVFKKFQDIKVSTKTFIAVSNIEINILQFFNVLPITKYSTIPKRRGRKRKNDIVNKPTELESGSIITLEFGEKLRGVDLKKKHDKKKAGEVQKYFRNSVTVVMIIEGKKINFKVSNNGKFQMTGCKYFEHAKQCIGYIWKYIKDFNNVYKISSEKFEVLFIPAMRNIDFSLGFIVDREKLDEYFNKHTRYNSLLETSFGYTGVNIKLPLTKSIEDLGVKKLIYNDNGWGDVIEVTYKYYLDKLNIKEREKKLKQKRYITFLVFHSGKVILSGLSYEFCEQVYYDFLNIIQQSHNKIKENLD